MAPSTHELAVVAPRSTLTLEEVSSRWKGSLVHPNREAMLVGVRFSADGKRLIAGDYPGGVIQLWEVETGGQFTAIETGYGYRGSFDYFFLSPDWTTVYVSRDKRKANKIEKEGKQLYRWEFEGEIRAWDLATGELQKTYRQTPMRGIRWMTISPDGSTFLVFEELPGESEGSPQEACSLVDAKTGRFRQLEGTLGICGSFSADSQMVPVYEMNAEGNEIAVRLYDVPTGKMTRSLPVGDNTTMAGRPVFSPDGKVVVVAERLVPSGRNPKERTARLRFWDVNAGKELASFRMDEKGSDIGSLVFSPDGRTMSATFFKERRCKLLLFDALQQRLARTVVLCDEKAITRPPVFSPDGRWIAVATQIFPEESERDSDPRAEDVSQPRIHLVEVATGAVRETLVAPQGFTASLCFSPDGKTLATGGDGRVDLWAVETIPKE